MEARYCNGCGRADCRVHAEVFSRRVKIVKDALKTEKFGHVLVISEKLLGTCVPLTTWCISLYGGADGTRTHDLCVANRTTGKTLSICLFEKLQPPRDINSFPVLSHSLPSRIRHVLFFLATYWPLGIYR